jgi:hypothetical protein
MLNCTTETTDFSIKRVQYKYGRKKYAHNIQTKNIKETVLWDFWPSVFSPANNTPESPDSWAIAVSNINSYSWRYSIFKFDYALAIQIFFIFFYFEDDPLWVNFC